MFKAFKAALPPQPDKCGVFWEFAVSPLGQPRQPEPREFRGLQQPQLLLCPSPAPAANKLGLKETTGRSTPCPALFEPKMDFKAAPALLALAGRGGNVGGRGVAIPACILMFHPAAHPEHITAFSVEINSNRGFFVGFRASRLKVSCVLFDFFL